MVLGAGQRPCLVGLSLWCLPVSSGWFLTSCGPHHSRPRKALATLHWHSCAPIQPPLQVAW